MTMAGASHAREASETARASGTVTRPCEATELHTRILRCMLAVDDCAAYWANVDPSVPAAERARVAFQDRWFGVKSEARARTILPDMTARFDAYPHALALLRSVPIPPRLRPCVCHVHTQLADPIYRRFTGGYLAERREQGFRAVELDQVSRWVEAEQPGRWSVATRTKFASNLLATAHDVGLVSGRRDPRALPVPAAPDLIVGYVLYLLREVTFEGTALDNPYLRALGLTRQSFGSVAARVPGVRFLGMTGELELTEPSLLAWGQHTLGVA
jgi:hypothetical protein